MLEAGLVIVAIVNQIKNVVPQKIAGLVAFVLAIALGVVFGALGWFGLSSVQEGFSTALVSSGVYTVAKAVGR